MVLNVCITYLRNESSYWQPMLRVDTTSVAPGYYTTIIWACKVQLILRKSISIRDPRNHIIIDEPVSVWHLLWSATTWPSNVRLEIDGGRHKSYLPVQEDISSNWSEKLALCWDFWLFSSAPPSIISRDFVCTNSHLLSDLAHAVAVLMLLANFHKSWSNCGFAHSNRLISDFTWALIRIRGILEFLSLLMLDKYLSFFLQFRDALIWLGMETPQWRWQKRANGDQKIMFGWGKTLIYRNRIMSVQSPGSNSHRRHVKSS